MVEQVEREKEIVARGMVKRVVVILYTRTCHREEKQPPWYHTKVELLGEEVLLHSPRRQVWYVFIHTMVFWIPVCPVGSTGLRAVAPNKLVQRSPGDWTPLRRTLQRHCTALSSPALHCPPLHCTVLPCTTLSSPALHCPPLHCTVRGHLIR